METEELTLSEKCENMMNIVVESRKRFGKMCIDYDQKTSLMENKILNLQIETIANYRFKPKNTLPEISVDDMQKDIDDFCQEIAERQIKLRDLRQKVKDIETIVLQLKQDTVTKKAHQPLTAEHLLKLAKERQMVRSD